LVNKLTDIRKIIVESPTKRASFANTFLRRHDLWLLYDELNYILNADYVMYKIFDENFGERLLDFDKTVVDEILFDKTRSEWSYIVETYFDNNKEVYVDNNMNYSELNKCFACTNNIYFDGADNFDSDVPMCGHFQTAGNYPNSCLDSMIVRILNKCFKYNYSILDITNALHNFTLKNILNNSSLEDRTDMKSMENNKDNNNIELKKRVTFINFEFKIKRNYIYHLT